MILFCVINLNGKAKGHINKQQVSTYLVICTQCWERCTTGVSASKYAVKAHSPNKNQWAKCNKNRSSWLPKTQSNSSVDLDERGVGFPTHWSCETSSPQREDQSYRTPQMISMNQFHRCFYRKQNCCLKLGDLEKTFRDAETVNETFSWVTMNQNIFITRILWQKSVTWLKNKCFFSCALQCFSVGFMVFILCTI